MSDLCTNMLFAVNRFTTLERADRMSRLFQFHETNQPPSSSKG